MTLHIDSTIVFIDVWSRYRVIRSYRRKVGTAATTCPCTLRATCFDAFGMSHQFALKKVALVEATFENLVLVLRPKSEDFIWFCVFVFRV